MEILNVLWEMKLFLRLLDRHQKGDAHCLNFTHGPNVHEVVDLSKTDLSF